MAAGGCASPVIDLVLSREPGRQSAVTMLFRGEFDAVVLKGCPDANFDKSTDVYATPQVAIIDPHCHESSARFDQI
jgi:hypothetical protein